MTSRERIRRVFAGQDTDVIPVMHIGFSSQSASLLLGYEAYVGGGIQQYREACALWEGKAAHEAFLAKSLHDAIAIGQKLHHDILRIAYWRMSAMPSDRLDEHTFVYEEKTDGARQVVRRFIPETEMFEVVGESEEEDPAESARQAARNAQRSIDPQKQYADILRARELVGDVPVRVGAAGLNIPFTATWLEATALDPETVERLLDAQVTRGLLEIEALYTLGVDLVFGGGDMASAQGPLYSPRTFETLMLPRLQTLAQACEARGMKYLFNSDGNLWPVADMLFGESGVHGYYEIDADAGMDLLTLRKRYPDLVLFGNLSSSLLHLGDPDGIRKQVRACIDVAKGEGRIVLGCSNQFVIGTPLENMRAMNDTIEAYR